MNSHSSGAIYHVPYNVDQYSPGWLWIHTDDTDGDDGLRYSPGWFGIHTDDTDGDDGLRYYVGWVRGE